MNSLLERKTEAHLQESGLSFPKDLKITVGDVARSSELASPFLPDRYAAALLLALLREVRCP
jgi:hypothetical protein